MSRNKGKRFERQLCNIVRARWPEATVRRSSQADRAYQADVFVEGGPAKLQRLWFEAQDARNPTPLAKLHQAERDSDHGSTNRLPVVVWHRIREQAIQATTRLWVIDALRGELKAVREEVVTMDFRDFLDLIT